jgi:CBS domain-containing protein
MASSEFEDAYEDEQRIRGMILSTPISDLTLRDPISVDASASVVDAVNAMNLHHTGCVLAQKGGKLAGILTERDILNKVAFKPNNEAFRVESVMTADPETLEADETIAFALNKMSVGGFRHIPIVDRSGKPVGVLSVRDIVDFLVELFPEGVLNLPSSSQKGIAKMTDGG